MLWRTQRGALIEVILRKGLLTVCLFQTTINTDLFNAWVIPNLISQLPAHSIVVMDNATFHKGEEVIKALKNRGHTPTYLPRHLNPIQKKWAKAI